MMHSIIRLPEIRLFKQELGHDKAWSDQYGALYVAADYCKIRKPNIPFVGVWQHGCFGPWSRHVPTHLTYHAPGAEKRPVFVARKDEELILISNGYNQAMAIGLPFVYLPELNIPRRKGSLLVLPAHTLAGSPHESIQELYEYANFIKMVSNKFSEVVVCLHAGCIENGQWSEQFEKQGIDWIAGATTNDANALLRMKMLFEQFEFVTTNTWGSHVAYALSCGAKVSIYGPCPQPLSIKTVLKDTGYGGKIEVIEMMRSQMVKNEQDDILSKFYVSPENGIKDIEIGRWLIGFDNKRSPKDLIAIFKWRFFDRIKYIFSFVAYKELARMSKRKANKFLSTLIKPKPI